jgi:adenosine 3'-phospho 5'-phosphosulfate transporter B2
MLRSRTTVSTKAATDNSGTITINKSGTATNYNNSEPVDSRQPLDNMDSKAQPSGTDEEEAATQMKPLMVESSSPSAETEQITNPVCPSMCSDAIQKNPEFFAQAAKFLFCFCGLQASYLTWGYMQELIMTTTFTPTPSAPDGKFPSAAFCVFSNRFLAIIVAMIAVRVKHGAILANNTAPLIAFTPCALSNTMSSWSQYASLRYVAFPVQTVFKSSKIIPVMIMGKVLKGTSYPWTQYFEAAMITTGVAVFSVASKGTDSDTTTQLSGLVFLLMYICFDSFTSQWQDKVYQKYGRSNVDPYQMMLGVNSSAILITTAGLVISGDIPPIVEFLKANPSVFQYNIITAITSASGQLCIYYTIKEFGPIVFTIIMTTRQMISICISSIIFGHKLTVVALLGACLVFGVLFYQIRRKYLAKKKMGGQR